MTRILITRPWEDAEPLARRLIALGHEVLIEPLLEIVALNAPAPILVGAQGLLFTSANGVRALARLVSERNLPVFAVGAATATAARDAGFARVISADGDVEALARLVIARCDPSAGPLFHAAASARAGDLSGHLEQAGFVVARAVLYEARPALVLGKATIAALRAGALDAVALFSPRTARTLVRLIAEAGMTEACRTLDVLCLSAAVAAAVAEGPESGGKLPWRTLRVAARADQAALLACLEAFPSGGR